MHVGSVLNLAPLGSDRLHVDIRYVMQFSFFMVGFGKEKTKLLGLFLIFYDYED